MMGSLSKFRQVSDEIEWASARVPPTPLLGGWAEGGWSISNPVTSQIFERETWFLSTQLAPT